MKVLINNQNGARAIKVSVEFYITLEAVVVVIDKMAQEGLHNPTKRAVINELKEGAYQRGSAYYEYNDSELDQDAATIVARRLFPELE